VNALPPVNSFSFFSARAYRHVCVCVRRLSPVLLLALLLTTTITLFRTVVTKTWLQILLADSCRGVRKRFLGALWAHSAVFPLLSYVRHPQHLFQWRSHLHHRLVRCDVNVCRKFLTCVVHKINLQYVDL